MSVKKGKRLQCKRCGCIFVDFDKRKRCPKCWGKELEPKGGVKVTNMLDWV